MQLPDYMIVKSFEWDSMRDVISSESTSGIILQKVRTGHRWDSRIRCDVLPAFTRQARGFLFSLQQDGAVLEYTDPDWVSSAFSRSASNLSNGVSVATISTNVDLEIGMMFNFSNHSKLYIITGVTSGTVSFMPEYVGGDVVAQMQFEAPKLTSEMDPTQRGAVSLRQTLMRDLTRVNLRLVESVG